MWRALSLKESRSHIRLDYTLFYSFLTFFTPSLRRCTNVHCSPFGLHQEIPFQSLTSSLLLQLQLWEYQDSQSVKANNGALKKKKKNASEEPPLSSPRTSSLHSTTSLPRSLTAMQEYFPPSKGLGLRMFRVSTPWLFCIKYFGSSPMIILFFIQTILGWKNKTKELI